MSTEQPLALAQWIDGTIRPDAFATIVLPFRSSAREPTFYLSLWTRLAEAALFGKSALHIANSDGRCLWFMVNEAG